MYMARRDLLLLLAGERWGIYELKKTISPALADFIEATPQILVFGSPTRSPPYNSVISEIEDFKDKNFVFPCAVPFNNGQSIIALGVLKKDDEYFIKYLVFFKVYTFLFCFFFCFFIH